MEKAIAISKGTELLRIPAKRLVYIYAEKNFSTIVTQDNRKRLVSYQLGQIEDLINNQLGDEGNHFSRLGRSLIINMDYVYAIDVTKHQVILSDCHGCYHELSASREVIIQLKAYLDVLMTHG